MFQLVTMTAVTTALGIAVVSGALRPRDLARLTLALALLAVPMLALAQTIDGDTVVAILPVSDKARANIAFGWLGLFYLAGLLKRWIPSHTIVGKALDFVVQDTRPPQVPSPKP